MANIDINYVFGDLSDLSIDQLNEYVERSRRDIHSINSYIESNGRTYNEIDTIYDDVAYVNGFSHFDRYLDLVALGPDLYNAYRNCWELKFFKSGLKERLKRIMENREDEDAPYDELLDNCHMFRYNLCHACRRLFRIGQSILHILNQW